jgi:hypothetical protein
MDTVTDLLNQLNMRQLLLIFILLFFFPIYGQSQSFTLEGTVTDANHPPLEAAHVHLNNHFSHTNAGVYFRLGHIIKRGYRERIS